MTSIPRYEITLHVRIGRIESALDDLREDAEDDAMLTVDGLVADFDRARERVVSLHEHDDDMTNLALREATRALDEVDDRIRWVRSNVQGLRSR